MPTPVQPLKRTFHPADGIILAFVLLFLVSGVLTLPRYGISWDEGLGSFFFGERYAYYLATFQEKYLDFKADLSNLQKLPLDTYETSFRDFPHEYPSIINTPSAALMHLLAYRLGWLDPVDAFHLLTVLLAAVFLWLLYRSGSRFYGRVPALFAVLFLGLFPRFWGDMHFNSKDLPELIFFGLALLALLEWHARPSWGRVFAAGLALGAAIAVKPNAYFIPIIYLLALLPWNLRRSDWLAALRGIWLSAADYLIIGLAAVELFLFSWPYLFNHAALRLRNYLHFVMTQGGRELDSPASLLPLRMALSVIPEWMLLCLGIGLVFLIVEIIRSNRFEHRLLLLWLVVPILRISLPNQANFDAIRHFMEFLPAAALTAGLGVERLAVLATRWRPSARQAVLALALAGILLNTAWIETRYRGFEHLYYNTLVGGFSGAVRVFGENEASDYWAVSYRGGVDWINHHAERGAAVHVPVAGWLVSVPRRAWLRSDLNLLDPELVSPPGQPLPDKAQQPTYVMFIRRPGYYNALAQRLAENAAPVYHIDLDGVPLLMVYRINPGDRLDTPEP